MALPVIIGVGVAVFMIVPAFPVAIAAGLFAIVFAAIHAAG